MFIELLVLTFVISFAGTFLIRGIAVRRNIIDIPNNRSSHIRPTPRGGGLAIAVAWFLAITLQLFFSEIPVSLYLALLCGIPITITGLIDDIITISPKIRFLVQVLSTTLALFFLGGFSSVDIGVSIINNSIIFNLAAVVGVVWLTNLFNFLDGIDGYLSVEIIFICLAAFIISGDQLPLLLAAATTGFLLWNWQPAKIFMGDVGSTLLGFTIGIFAVYYQNINQASIIIWLMLSSLFWFDATLTLLRRLRNRENLSQAHKKHGYQRIVQSGFSHQKTVLISVIINLIIFGLVWFASVYPSYLLVLFFMNIIYLYFVMKLVDRRFSFKKN